MAKRGLPNGVGLRHDSHYVEDLTRANRTVGRILPIDKIEPNPEQPRVEIGDLDELTSSIKEKGVLEPLLVKPIREKGTWMIIAGERRWRSANLAGLKEVPCIELDLDDKEVAEIALIENMQRKDLTVWEEADGLAALGTRFGYTHDEIARKIGKSRSTVTEAMAIAGLPQDIRRKCLEYKLNAKSTLLEIARQFDEKSMHRFIDAVHDKKRDEIRRTARPHTRTKDIFQAANVEKNSSSETAGGDKINIQVFEYISDEGNFSVAVKARDNSFGQKEIISALQETLRRLQI